MIEGRMENAMLKQSDNAFQECRLSPFIHPFHGATWIHTQSNINVFHIHEHAISKDFQHQLHSSSNKWQIALLSPVFCKLLSEGMMMHAVGEYLYRHVQTVHSHLFREPHTFACCDTTFSAAGVLFKHLVSRHKDQHLVLVERNGVLHLQPFSTLRRNREMLPKGPDAVEEDDSLDNTPSLHVDTISKDPMEHLLLEYRCFEGLESLTPFPFCNSNEDNVEVNPPSMPADFDFFIDMEVEVEEGGRKQRRRQNQTLIWRPLWPWIFFLVKVYMGMRRKRLRHIMGLDRFRKCRSRVSQRLLSFSVRAYNSKDVCSICEVSCRPYGFQLAAKKL